MSATSANWQIELEQLRERRRSLTESLLSILLTSFCLTLIATFSICSAMMNDHYTIADWWSDTLQLELGAWVRVLLILVILGWIDAAFIRLRRMESINRAIDSLLKSATTSSKEVEL